MIPKLTRRTSFGHTGTLLPALVNVRAIFSLLYPAITSFVSLISTVRLACLTARSPGAVREDAGGSGPAQPGPGGDGSDDVRVQSRRRLACLGGCPHVDRDDRVPGPADLGRVRPRRRFLPATRRRTRPAHWQPRPDPGRATGPRRDRHGRVPEAAPHDRRGRRPCPGWHTKRAMTVTTASGRGPCPRVVG